MTENALTGPGDEPLSTKRVAGRLPILLGVLALAVYALGYWNPAYRYDEYLVAVARPGLSWAGLLHVIANTDPAPGVLYLLMKPWTALSTDPAWTRVPSLVAMAVATGALVAFVEDAVDTRTAIYAGVLAILLPGMSRWAQDNRMYAPATAFLALALLSWWCSITRGSRRWAIAYGGAVFLMGLFHLYTLAWLPVLGLASLWAPGPRRTVLVRTLAPPATAIVFLLPFVALNIAHPTGAPTNPPASVPTIGYLVASNFGLVLAPLVALLALGGAIEGWRLRERRMVLVIGIAWVLLPLAAFIVARVTIHLPTLVDRYFVFVVPGACIVAGMGLSTLHARSSRAALLTLALITVLAVPAGMAVREVDAHSPEGYDFGQLLRQPALAGIPIVGLTRTMELRIDAATYPDRLATDWTQTPGTVVVVVHHPESSIADSANPYLLAGGPWSVVIACQTGYGFEVDVLATPDASRPDALRLATDLNRAVPRTRCKAADTQGRQRALPTAALIRPS